MKQQLTKLHGEKDSKEHDHTKNRPGGDIKVAGSVGLGCGGGFGRGTALVESAIVLGSCGCRGFRRLVFGSRLGFGVLGRAGSVSGGSRRRGLGSGAAGVSKALGLGGLGLGGSAGCVGIGLWSGRDGDNRSVGNVAVVVVAVAVASVTIRSSSNTAWNRSRNVGEIGVGAPVHVEADGLKRAENIAIVSDFNVVTKTVVAGELVGLGTGLCDVVGEVVALDADVLEGNVKVARALDVFSVPVDSSTGPVNSTLTVGRRSTRPQGDLNDGRSLGKFVDTGGGIVSVGLLEDTAGLAIDQPGDGVFSPVNSVGVIVFKGIRKRNVLGVGIVEISLPVKVCLDRLEVGADGFVVDFVLDGRHEDESRNDTLGAGSLQGGRNLTVPNGTGGSQDGTVGSVCHGEEDIVVVFEDGVTGDEIVLGSVTEVL